MGRTGNTARLNPIAAAGTTVDEAAAIVPRSAAVTEETAKAINAAEREHRRPRDGHALKDERGTPCGLLCVRKACSCGWRGQWRRAI